MGCDMLWLADYSANDTDYAMLDPETIGGKNSSTYLKQRYEMISHYVYHILLPIVLAFGVFGNVLNLTVFTRRRIREGMSEIEKAATTGLMFLAVADLLFCLAGLVGHLLHPFSNVYADSPVTTVAFYFTAYQRAIFNSLLFISTWLVVVVSVERYLAVSYPFQARQFVRVRRTVAMNVCVYVLSFVFNIPLFLEWRVEEESTCIEGCTCYMLVHGVYGKSPIFQKVYTVLWSVVGTFLPLGILIICNIKFLLEIYKSRKTFGITAGGSNSSPHQRFTRLTAILVAVIIMFFILVCPSMLIGFLKTKLDPADWSDTAFYRFRIAEAIFNLTQALNFSINFLLYCSLSREFRRTLNAMVCRWKNSVTSLASSPTKLQRSRSDAIEDTALVAGSRRSREIICSCGGANRKGSLVHKLSQLKESLSSVNKSNGITYV